MIHEIICSHADLQALQTRSDDKLYVNLVSLESLRIAAEFYALLRPPVEVNSWWLCRQLKLLSLVAGLALELHKVEQDLLPPLLDREAKLEGGVLKTLLLLNNSSMALLRLGKAVRKLVAKLDGSHLEEEEEPREDELSFRVKDVGLVLNDTADMVLNEHHNIVWLQARVPPALDLVIALLAAPVRFPE